MSAAIGERRAVWSSFTEHYCIDFPPAEDASAWTCWSRHKYRIYQKTAYGVYDNPTAHADRQFGAGTNIVGAGATSSVNGDEYQSGVLDYPNTYQNSTN